MKTHLESAGGLLAKEVIDSYDTFECNRGHKWSETLENRWDIPRPITFPIPNGDNICPFCLSELLWSLGRVSKITIRSINKT